MNKIGQRLGIAFVTATLALFGGSQSAHANLWTTPALQDSLGYVVLYEGAGAHTLEINSSVNANNHSGFAVFGNVGLGMEPNGSGTPTFNLNNPGSMKGKVNFAGTINSVGNVNPVGAISGGITQVETDLDALNSLSQTLIGEAGTPLTINIANNQTQPVNATSGTLDANGNYVFTVTSMNFVNGATLTINGTAAQSVVLNFGAGVNTHFGGNILLSGGISQDNVLFNIDGGNYITLTGGDTLQEAANGVLQYGTFLDPTGAINMDAVTVSGHIFGGDSTDFHIVSGANIVPEPAPIGFLAMGFGLFALMRARARR